MNDDGVNVNADKDNIAKLDRCMVRQTDGRVVYGWHTSHIDKDDIFCPLLIKLLYNDIDKRHNDKCCCCCCSSNRAFAFSIHLLTSLVHIFAPKDLTHSIEFHAFFFHFKN